MTLDAGKKASHLKTEARKWLHPRVNNPITGYLLTFFCVQSDHHFTGPELDQQSHHIIRAVITGEPITLIGSCAVDFDLQASLADSDQMGLCAAGLLDNSFYFYQIPPEHS